MVDVLSHRGPDATGRWSNPEPDLPVFLGHTRLSIIDLSAAANQPFRKNGLVLVFNGEIYNYRELRDELRGYGISFETSSDSEVLVEAWQMWSHKCLDKLRGMFAFAIFDERTRKLFLARDHFGIKPLF
jgi:asparagine synthase (glutamine-hydrolysing)